MEEKFLLTDEEINEALLRSPYSLPSSPSEQGLSASTIKKFFYDFIFSLGKSINLHLADLGAELAKQASKDSELEGALGSHDISALAHQSLITELRGLISNLEKAHTVHEADPQAHSSCIVAQVASHNSSTTAHADIRQLASDSGLLAQRALNLASGKSKVIPVEAREDMLEYIQQNQLFVGDVFILEEKNTPDFTYFGTVDDSYVDSEIAKGAILIDYDKVATSQVDLAAGCVYIFEGKKLVASESGFDISLLAKQEELNRVAAQLDELSTQLEATLSEIDTELTKKEEALAYVESSEENPLIESGKEYSLGLRASLSFKLPEEIDTGYFAIVSFRTGAEEASFLAPEGALISGDDCQEGTFVPQTSRLYELSIKSVSGIPVIRVAGADYEVI